jgi:hypothetical protein
MLQEEYNRKLKAITENMSVRETDIIIGQYNIDIFCDIKTKNSLYEICISLCDNDDFYFNCTCPDFMIRKCICKHIYWFGYRQLNELNVNKWTRQMIHLFWVNDLSKKNIHDCICKNDICPICKEIIKYDEELSLKCECCENAVHSLCWINYQVYGYRLYNNKCVICRTDFMS